MKSIARRHPAIGDENRWQEIAQLNEMNVWCDADGEPLSTLTRGQKIYLPKPKTIIDELEDEGEDTGCSRIDSILSLGGYDPGAHDGETVAQKANNVVAFVGAGIHTRPRNVVKTRVITQNDLGDATKALNLRLEMKVDNHWLPVVEYSISAEGSGKSSDLKVYDLYGVRHVIPLGLATRDSSRISRKRYYSQQPATLLPIIH